MSFAVFAVNAALVVLTVLVLVVVPDTPGIGYWKLCGGCGCDSRGYSSVVILIMGIMKA